MTTERTKQARNASFTAAIAIAAMILLAGPSGQAANNPEDQVQRTFEKTLPLAANQGLSLDNRFGNVHVIAGNGRDVKIVATIRVQGKSREDAQKFLDEIQIDVQQTSDGVDVKTVYPDDHAKYVLRIQWKRTSYSVNYDVTLPVDAPLWLRNDCGNVDTSGVHGWTRVENGHGAVGVNAAGQTKITNAFGGIELSNANGNSAIVNNTGNITLSNVKGTIDVKNRFGNITGTQLSGNATISGGNGNIEISSVTGNAVVTNSFGTVTAHTIGGSLTVHDTNAKIEASDVTGNAELATSFGEVIAERIGGSLQVQDNNGQVQVREIHGITNIKSSFGKVDAANLYKAATLVTGNGNIEANGVDGDLFAKTSFGSVDAKNIKGNLTAQDTNGAVTASAVSGDAGVDTSFGSVNLDGVGGKIRVNNQNGAIEVTAASSGACKDIVLKTSFSHVIVRIPATSGYKVSAHTSFGRISSELPITATGTMGSDALEGTIGNGACALGLSNSNGSIEIAKSL